MLNLKHVELVLKVQSCSSLSVFVCIITHNSWLFHCPDVYSYDEDDMVLDSKLAEHLAHFGIDMMTMEKVS